MVYDYINTKPPLNEDTLASYGIDADSLKHWGTSRSHKYIKRWRGALGKWYYTYPKKKEAKRIFTNINNILSNKHNAIELREKATQPGIISGRKRVADKKRAEEKAREERIKIAINAGRKRVADKKRAAEKAREEEIKRGIQAGRVRRMSKEREKKAREEEIKRGIQAGRDRRRKKGS